MPAVAISDRCNLFALVKFYNAAEESGIKPIVASDIRVVEDDIDEKALTPLVLIARTDTGYRNLCNLLSQAYVEGQFLSQSATHADRQASTATAPCLKSAWLAAASEGLIALSGGREGDVGRALLAGNRDEAERRASAWMQIFPDAFYLELHRTGRTGEEEYNAQAVELAAALSCPVVATNDVRFLAPADFETHEVRVCIHEGRTLNDPRRERRYSDQQYLKSAAEMCALFEDLPEAIENTVEIARRCNVQLQLGENHLPEYPVPDGATTESYLEELAGKGLDERLKQSFDTGAIEFSETRKPYDERLAFELDIINRMGYPGYFLIVMEFIAWARDNDIPVGPGRGSGPGSLVAYSLKITDIDPLEYDLLFERFLNPERVTLPDFDIDFCMDGREAVIRHVAERYGRDAVSQIVTFGTMAAKAVIYDVARAQAKPLGLSSRLANLVPKEPGMTLTLALEKEPELVELMRRDDEADEIMEMAFKLEGLTRNVGKHAGGVVIAPTRLADFSPVYCDDRGGGLMTQFDMHDIEQAGLVKFDFLGLKTLTVIHNAVQSINARLETEGKPAVNIERLPLDDAAIYKDLQQARTTTIFQLESPGMKKLVIQVHPSKFADLVALMALYRPGPMELKDDFVNRKMGKEKVDYLHPSLKHVLEDTYGVMLYQEQVMQIAQILAGFSLADADLLRRAMGKKKPDEMATQREVFLKGALANNVGQAQASHIFGLMEKFAGYGFNKPHSVAYAHVAYQTAWLKHYFPAEFMAAVLTADMQSTDRVAVVVDDCRAIGLTVLAPDVNRSEYRFVANAPGSIVYGLGAIKGLGHAPIDALVEERQTHGNFSDLYEFCERIELRKLNKKRLEALLGSGALDCLVDDINDGARATLTQAGSTSDSIDQSDYKRALLIANLDEAVGFAELKARNEDQGVMDMFADHQAPDQERNHGTGTPGAAGQPDTCRYRHTGTLKYLTIKERLDREKIALGLFLSGHPVDQYRDELKALARTRIAGLSGGRDERTIAGIVVDVFAPKRRNDGLLLATLDDKSGRIVVAVSGKLLAESKAKLVQDQFLLVKGRVSDDEYSGGLRLRASSIQTLTEARARKISRIKVNLDGRLLGDGFVDELRGLLQPFKGSGRKGCRVAVAYTGPDVCGEIIFGEEWRVLPEDDLLRNLKERYGPGQVQLLYF